MIGEILIIGLELAYLIRPAKGDERYHKIMHKNGVVDDNRASNLMWE